MSTTTALTAPVRFSAFGADLVAATVWAKGLEQVMVSDPDVEALGLLTGKGDLTGSGSDTLTSVAFDGVGANAEMTALSTETSQATPSAYTLITDTITVGFYGYATEQTFKGIILTHPDRILSIDDMIMLMPALRRNTIKNLYTDIGATVTTAVGSASTALSLDDIIAVSDAVQDTAGANEYGMPNLTLHPTQVKQLKRSIRAEPAFQRQVDSFVGSQGVWPTFWPNFLGLGFNLLISDRVTTSGGAFQGFAHARDAFGIIRANYSGVLRALQALGPSPIAGVADNANGMILFTSASQAASQIAALHAMMVVGVGKVAASRRFQRRVISSTSL